MHKGFTTARSSTCSQHKKSGDDAAAATARNNHHHKHAGEPLSTSTKKPKTTAAAAQSPLPATRRQTGGGKLRDLCIGGQACHLQPKPQQQQHLHRGLKRPHAGPTTPGQDQGEADFKVARGDSSRHDQETEVAHEHHNFMPTPLEVSDTTKTTTTTTGGERESHQGSSGDDGDSVIAQCIRRFRDQPAMSREEREKLRLEGSAKGTREDDFWWRSSQSRARKNGLEAPHCAEEVPRSRGGGVDEEEEEDGASSGSGNQRKSPEEPLSSLTSQDEEVWVRDDSMEEGGDLSGIEGDEDDETHHDLHAEQRALECGEGPDSDLDSRAEALLQKCKTVLKDFYGPDTQTAKVDRGGKRRGASYCDIEDHDEEDDGEEEGIYTEADGRRGGSDGEGSYDGVEDDQVEEEEDVGRGRGLGLVGSCKGQGGASVELTGYVDQLLGEALNLSLEKPEEAVERLRARLGLSEERESGKTQHEDEGQPRQEPSCSKMTKEEEVEAHNMPPPPPPPSALDVVSAMMEMNPLPPLPSPREHPYMDEFGFLPDSPVDSTRATLDSSSTATDVSLDMTPGDLRCLEDEGVDMSLRTHDTDGSSSLFDLSSSSESGSFLPSYGSLLDQRLPFHLPRPMSHDASSPPPKALRQPLTVSIPQSNDMLRVRRSPSNSPRRREDGSAYYYVPESTCNTARCLVSKIVHRGLFVPRGVVSTQGKSDQGNEETVEGGGQAPLHDRLDMTPVAAPSSTNSVFSSEDRIMEVEEHGHTGTEGQEAVRARRREAADDDNALIEGQMYDTDPIVHALRRRARELKGLLGVM